MSSKTSASDAKHRTVDSSDVPITTSVQRYGPHKLLKGLGKATCLTVQIPSALIISQYDPSHSARGKERIERFFALCNRLWNSSLRIAQLPEPKFFYHFPLPKFVVDPSAATFLNAVMIYASAVILFYNLGNSRHQDRFLSLGGFIGILIGVSFMWFGSGLEALKDSVPASITTVLTLGQLWHIVQPWFLG